MTQPSSICHLVHDTVPKSVSKTQWGPNDSADFECGETEEGECYFVKYWVDSKQWTISALVTIPRV